MLQAATFSMASPDSATGAQRKEANISSTGVTRGVDSSHMTWT